MNMHGIFGLIPRDGVGFSPLPPEVSLHREAWSGDRVRPPLAKEDHGGFATPGMYANGWARSFVSDGVHVAGEAYLVNHAEFGPGWRGKDALELVAALYRRHAIRAFERLQGQFCLALYDARERRLVLAADRFATRVIYYTEKADTVIFGTGLNRVAAHQRRTIDPQAILEYLLYTVIPAPRTPFTAVRKLPAAHLLVVDSGGMHVRPYWDMSYPESRNHAAAVWARQLRSEIEAAVGRYAAAEESAERIGAFLSGGTDSSTVSGMIGKITGRPARTFSIGYVEEGYDELFYARVASRWFGTAQHEWKLSSREALDSVPAIVGYYQEPFGNASALPTYRCARLAREHGVTVLYAGDGGDELFAGNERYRTDKIFGLYQHVPAPLRRWLMDPLIGAFPERSRVLGRARRYVRRSNIANPRRMFSYDLLVSEPLENLLTPAFLAEVKDAQLLSTAEAHYHRPAHGTAELNRLLYLDLKLAIADNDVRKVSGMTELAGVEVRYPFLDAGLVEFSARIPARLKLRGLQKRYIFKQALADFLPPEILKKPKHGFGAPVAVWMKTDARWRAFVGDVLHDPRTRQRGYVRPAVIDDLWKHAHTGEASYYGDSLWPLLMLELWEREHGRGV
jgi:asparagine synthase (glutamine-hydrolysing)